MTRHRFAVAAESSDPVAISALIAEDVTFHTPILTEDLRGKDLTLKFLGEATRIIADLAYTDEVGDDELTILFWDGTVDQREISGATVLVEDEAGLISDITVLLRSWGVVANFRDTMLRALADVVPLPAWLLGKGTAPAPDPVPVWSDAGEAAVPAGCAEHASGVCGGCQRVRARSVS